MSNESKVREQFEAWVRSIPPDHGYNALDTWQASRAAALEEAAEALRLPRPNSEGYKRSEWDKFDWEQPCADAIDTAFDIGAAAIRALAAKEGL